MAIIATPLPQRLRSTDRIELNRNSWQAAGLLSWFPIARYRDGRNLGLYKLPRSATPDTTVGGVVSHGHRRGVQFPGSGTDSHYYFLDGAGGYYGPIRNTYEFSLFMWINAAAIGTYITAFSQGTGWIQLVVQASGVLGCSVNGLAYFNSSATLSANTWYHVGFTSVGQAQKLYINGTQDGSASQTPAVGASAAHINHGRIGAHNAGSNAWNGLIDDVRIYQRTLSANEVAAIYYQTRDGGYGDLAIQPTRFHHLPVAAAVVSKPRMTLLGVG